MTEPTSFLVPPGEPTDSVTGGFANPTAIFNYLSPSAWLNSIIEDISGVDIFGYATEAFTGEWAKLYQFGDAMANLARFMQEVGIQIQREAIRMDASWDGNAADSAYNYFTALAAATSRQQDALNAAAEGYHDAARGAWQLSEQLGNLLQAIADKALIVGIASTVGTATFETGVGPVIGYAVAAWQAYELIELVNKASLIINTAGTVIMGAFGGTVAFAGQGGDLSAVPVPTVPYAPPGA